MLVAATSNNFKAAKPPVAGSPAGISAAKAVDIERQIQVAKALKATSDKILAQNLKNPSSSDLGMLQAIWQAIMNILRAIARAFGFKTPHVAEGTSSALKTEAGSVGAIRGSGASEPDDVVDQASVTAKMAAVSNLADQSSAAIGQAMEGAKAMPPAMGNAFLDALTYAGLDPANTAMLQLAQNPQSMKESAGLEHLLKASFLAAQTVLGKLNGQQMMAQAARAESAGLVTAQFKAPLLVEDMVTIYRTQPQLAASDPYITRLLQADDALVAITRHREAVVQSMASVASSARVGGVDLVPHLPAIASVLGSGWEELVDAAAAANISPKSIDAAHLDSQNQAAAAAFIAGLTPIPAAPVKAGLSIRERMRLASQTTPPDSFSDAETQEPLEPAAGERPSN